ncbi:hypothetical protein [Blastochloris sulfoviridis]|uniref:Uncharacterized protein n=1 Tax=Blastochloris sulfoviridis TaxID=50712 RepID=A0A5M6I2W8_9HYPH|nr:hypothetical protein [Blastochloris sulfoviridis]KAA5602135.1 hypothetical protein F1193_07135 [Blastochloris sulfoviridis]
MSAGTRGVEAHLAIALSCLSLALAGGTLVMLNLGAPKSPTPLAAVDTGPVAHVQWQETLRTAFDDLSRMPITTLPLRGDVGFGLITEPDPSMLAQPEIAPSAMPKS